LVLWFLLPLRRGGFFRELSVLFLFRVLRVGVYVILARGWSSNSEYAILGALRGVAQTISYEVSLVIIFLGLAVLVQSLRL